MLASIIGTVCDVSRGGVLLSVSVLIESRILFIQNRTGDVGLQAVLRYKREIPGQPCPWVACCASLTCGPCGLGLHTGRPRRRCSCARGGRGIRLWPSNGAQHTRHFSEMLLEPVLRSLVEPIPSRRLPGYLDDEQAIVPVDVG